MTELITYSLPIIIGLLGYLLHRMIEKIDADIADSNKTALRASLKIDDMAKVVSMIEAQGKASHAELRSTLDLHQFKVASELQDLAKAMNSLTQDVTETKQNYGKIIQILNKLVVIRQLQNAKKQDGA